MDDQRIGKLGFIVEDDPDRDIVEKLATRVLGPGWKIHAVRLGGRAAARWAYAAALILLDEHGYDHVVLVLDSDTNLPSSVEQTRLTLEERFHEYHLEDCTSVCLAVPTIEAWLLATIEPRPEAMPNPTQMLRDRPVSLDDVVDQLDLARSRSPSLDRFLQTIEAIAAHKTRAQAPLDHSDGPVPYV